MSTVKAVVIKSGDSKPRFIENFSLREPTESEVRVKVLGTSIHHLVRMRALGKHYSVSANDTSEKLIGIDGVGLIDDKQLVFFITLTPGTGSFAEYVNVDKRFIFPFPEEITKDDTDAIARVTTLSNPAMSSYLVFDSRLSQVIEPGFTVAINGVTGASGSLAAEIARKKYGASKVIGVGRSEDKLKALVEPKGLDAIIPLTDSDEEMTKKFSEFDVDVVLDYTWGKAAERTLLNLIKSRKDSTKLLSFVQIGQIGGTDFNIPPGILRGHNLHILGSGLGSFTTRDAGKAFPDITAQLAKGQFGTDEKIETAKASDIEQEWDLWQPSARKVFTF